MEPDISFSRAKRDLVVTCDLSVWHRLPNRYGYHEKASVELAQEIMLYANVTVFCSARAFPAEGSEFPDTTETFEIAPAVVHANGKRLTIKVRDYEQQPLKPLSTGNHGFFLQQYGVQRHAGFRFDLDAWISFRLPGPFLKDTRDWTLGRMGKSF